MGNKIVIIEINNKIPSQYQDLTIASQSEIDKEINPNLGIKNVWVNILEFIQENQIKTYNLSELL